MESSASILASSLLTLSAVATGALRLAGEPRIHCQLPSQRTTPADDSIQNRLVLLCLLPPPPSATRSSLSVALPLRLNRLSSLGSLFFLLVSAGSERPSHAVHDFFVNSDNCTHDEAPPRETIPFRCSPSSPDDILPPTSPGANIIDIDLPCLLPAGQVYIYMSYSIDLLRLFMSTAYTHDTLHDPSPLSVGTFSSLALPHTTSIEYGDVFAIGGYAPPDPRAVLGSSGSVRSSFPFSVHLEPELNGQWEHQPA